MGINRPRKPSLPKGQRQKPPSDAELFALGEIDQEEYEARLARKARARGAIARTKFGVARGPRKLGAGEFYRRAGTKITYDRDQTAHYLSPKVRLAKAVEIKLRWDELVEEIPIENNVTLYLVASDRATDGYWTVKRREKPPNAPLPPPPLPPLPPNQPPTPGQQGVQEPIYVLNFNTSIEGLPPGMTAQSRRISVNGVSYPYLGGETYTDPNNGGIVIASSVLAINAPQVETLGNFTGLSLLDLQQQGITYWLRSGKIYSLSNGSSLIVIIYEYVGPQPYPNAYELDATQIAYRPPANQTTPLELRGSADNIGRATPLEGTPATPGTPGLPDPNPLPPIPPVQPDADPPQIDYECNCPDYTRIELMDPSIQFESRYSDRVWIDSQAGCDVETGCKHIMAVKLHHNEYPL